MKTSYRDLTCGELRPEHAGREVTLSGWVNRRRDMGQLIFIDLRDRHGLTQVVIDAAESPEAHEIATGVRNEFVLRVEGKVAKRLAGTENAKLATGEIEVRATVGDRAVDRRRRRRSRSTSRTDTDETLRLKYRYLDLRREQINHRLVLRSQAAQGALARCTTRTASSRSRRPS